MPLRLDARLREHGMGSWEGLTRDEVAERFPDQYADWMAGRPVRGRGGEEPAAVAERAVAALADLPAGRRSRSSSRTAARRAGCWSGCSASAPTTAACSGRWATARGASSSCQGGRWRLLRHNSSVLQLPEVAADGARAAAPACGRCPAAGAAPDEARRRRPDADAVL